MCQDFLQHRVIARETGGNLRLSLIVKKLNHGSDIEPGIYTNGRTLVETDGVFDETVTYWRQVPRGQYVHDVSPNEFLAQYPYRVMSVKQMEGNDE